MPRADRRATANRVFSKRRPDVGSQMVGTTDRRAAERMAVNSGTACAFAAPVAEDFGPTKVRDVSMEGVGLVSVRRVPVGTLLVVGLTNPDRGVAKTALVRVEHVTPIHGGILVACEFLESLTYEEFKALVT
jgi:hypothetical protein